MKKMILVLIVLAVGVLAGCGSQGTTLTGEEADAVLAFSEAKTDNLLAGMNAGDYAVFSQDFDADMLAAMTESQFRSLKTDRDTKLGLYNSREVASVVQTDRDTKLGLYNSREVASVVQTGDFYAVNYTAKFEKQDAVPLRVVFQMAEPHEVSGLWFGK